MSRRKANEVTSPLSLFPFIGVLLSTMGALLVVLVAVSRSARDSAMRVVESERAAVQSAAPPVEDENSRELKKVNEYVARLNDVQSEAEKRLRDDQLRLSHAEDHMRRLQDQLANLKAAMGELDTIDKDHLDDRRQAEREVERLHQLVADTQGAIKALKESSSTKKRSYAIIPYDGPYGTRRRPIYIECRKDEVILQPEGIKLTEQDFLPPVDSGNPLASALRAAREQLVREAGGIAPSKQTEPYPLILIRPDGIAAYYSVREAIASWDADFGYEFVGDDWKLEFSPANPQIARLAQSAVEQARIRRRVLAAAAPRAYRSSNAFDIGDASDDDDGDGGPFESNGGYASDGGGGSSPRSGGTAGRNSSGMYALNPEGRAGEQPGGGGGGGKMPGPYDRIGLSGTGGDSRYGTQGQGGAVQNSNGVATGGTGGSQNRGGGESGPTAGSSAAASGNGGTSSGGGPGGPSSQPSSGNGAVAGGPAVAGSGHAGGSMSAGSVVNNGSGPSSAGGAADGQPGQIGSSASGMPSMPPAQVHGLPQRISPKEMADAKGADWALGGKGAAAVPVRRSIQVIVRRDRIALLPDSGNQTEGGREIALDGPMSKQVDDIVEAVQKHVNDWGIAGHGLYWRPVLVLNVGPDAGPRAAELAQLLKDSGIDLRTAAVSQQIAPQAPSVR